MDIVWDKSDLQPGECYQLSKETPLMPSPNPLRPLAALKKARYIPEKYIINIRKIWMEHGGPWYYVNVRDPGGKYLLCSGWINSIALIGQDLKRKKKGGRRIWGCRLIAKFWKRK